MALLFPSSCAPLLQFITHLLHCCSTKKENTNGLLLALLLLLLAVYVR